MVVRYTHSKAGLDLHLFKDKFLKMFIIPSAEKETNQQ